MDAIPSAIRGRDARLTFPLHIDINHKLTTAKHDFFRLKSVSQQTLQFHVETLPAQLEEYFKRVAGELKTNFEPVISGIAGIDWTDKQSIMDGLQPILDYLKPVFEYVKAHPWILIPIIIPALELFIGLLGFGAEGVVAGSIAAGLQSSIGNVAKDSLFAFLQSVGAGGWAFAALELSNFYVTIAVIISAIGEFLINYGVMNPDAAKDTMEGVWNKQVHKYDPPTRRDPPVRSVGSQVMILNLDGGIVRYGLLAWVLMYGAVCVGDGGVF